MSLYTSGTSGAAKGVQLSHYNCVAEAKVFTTVAKAIPAVAISLVSARHLVAVSIHRITAQVIISVQRPYSRLGAVYFMPKYEIVSLLENIQRFQITDMITNPRIIEGLANDPNVRSGRYDLSSLKNIGDGGRKIASRMYRDVAATHPSIININVLWGMME